MSRAPALLCGSILALALASPQASLALSIGDLDGNLRIDSGDVLLLERSLRGLVVLTPMQQEAADVAPLGPGGSVGDDLVDLGDLLILRRAISGGDVDGDGLSTTEENALGISPFSADTDGDGFEDGHEVAAGTDPTDPSTLNLPPDAPLLSDLEASHVEVTGTVSACSDDGLPVGTCTQTVRAVAAGGACGDTAVGDGPVGVASDGTFTLSGLAPGTSYRIFATSSDSDLTTCSNPSEIVIEACASCGAGFELAEPLLDDPFSSGRFVDDTPWPSLWHYDTPSQTVQFDASLTPARGAFRIAQELEQEDHCWVVRFAANSVAGDYSLSVHPRVDPDDPDNAQYRALVGRSNGSTVLAWDHYDDTEQFTPIAEATGVALPGEDEYFYGCLTGEGDDTEMSLGISTTWPGDVPEDWTFDQVFTTNPPKPVDSGNFLVVRGFAASDATADLAISSVGAQSLPSVGPTPEPLLSVIPTSPQTRTAPEGGTVPDVELQICNAGDAPLADWATQVIGTPDDITIDNDPPNTSWITAAASGTDLAPDSCENVVVAIIGEENGDVGGPYEGTVRASTNDMDSTVATVDRTVSLSISEAGTGDVDAALAASVSSGPSPLAVFFDARDTAGGVNPFHRLSYEFVFGEVAKDGSYSETWGVWPTRSSQNDTFLQQYSKDRYVDGPMAGHVYEPASFPDSCTDDQERTVDCSRFTAQVTARNSDGNTGIDTVIVEVWDPDDYWPGTDTVCIGNSEPTAGSGGCPSGAETRGTSACSIASDLAAGKRALFQRGDTFGACGAVSDPDDPSWAQIGAFGTGAKPAFNISSDAEWLRFGKPNLVLHDLDVNCTQSTGASDKCIDWLIAGVLGKSDYTHVGNALIRVEVSGGKGNSATHSGSLEMERLAIVDSILEDIAPGSNGFPYFGAFNRQNMILGSLLGGGTSGAEANLRITTAENGNVVAFNKFHKNPLSGKGNARIANPNDPGDTFESRELIYGYNTRSPEATRGDTFCCDSGGSNGNPRNFDYIIEGNFFPDVNLILAAVDGVTARNNVGVQFLMWAHENGVPAHRWSVENNSLRLGGTGSQDLIRIREDEGSQTGQRLCRNNIIYAPNGIPGLDAEDECASTTDLLTTTNPFEGINPGADLAEWEVPDGSAACSAGTAATGTVGALVDILSVVRGGSPNQGARENACSP